MKISLVAMRPLPGTTRPALSRSGSSPVIPPRPSTEHVTPCPTCVEPALWDLLLRRIAEARHGSAIANREFRAVVRGAVRQLRASGEPWEVVYATLEAAVRPAPDAPATQVPGLEVHASRGAAIVAHMHSWADVERLAELGEGEGMAS